MITVLRLLFSAFLALLLAILSACGGGGCEDDCKDDPPLVKSNPPNCNASGVCT